MGLQKYQTEELLPNPADLAGLAAMVLAPFMAAAIVPAWRAAIVDPMQAMRS